MAINSLSIPTYQRQPDLDFSSLAQLPQVYRQARNEAVRRQTLAELGQGGQIDPMRLIQSGDLNLANLGISVLNRQQEAARQAERDKITDARADRQFGATQALQQAQLDLSRRAASRADETANRPTIQKVKDEAGNESLVAVYPDGRMKPLGAGGGGASGETGNPFGGGKFNEGQGKAAGFADRMLQSEAILSGMDVPAGAEGPPVPGLDREGLSIGAKGASKVPMIGNFLVGQNFQQYDQAKRDFINAQLRRESGATIQPSEFESADRQYFPVPGDSPQVIEQKRANRRAAVSAMGREGGPSYRPEVSFGQSGMLRPRRGPTAQQPMTQGKPITQEQYNALPSGTPFTAPDGTQRIKP